MAKGKATSGVRGPAKRSSAATSTRAPATDPSIEELDREEEELRRQLLETEKELAAARAKQPKGKRSPSAADPAAAKAKRDLYNAKRRDKRQTVAAAKLLTGLSPKKSAAPAAKSPSKKRTVVRTDKVRAAERRSAARHFGSKSEVFHEQANRYGELKTRSGLQKKHLVEVEKEYNKIRMVEDAKGNLKPEKTGEKHSRKRIAYRSRHEVGLLIKKMMYEPIRDSEHLEERKQEVKDYLETSIRLKHDPNFLGETAAPAADGFKYLDEDAIMKELEKAMAKSSLLERYDSIDPKKGGIVAHNNKVKEWSKTWKATNEKQRGYFTNEKRAEKSNEAYYNFKKPRLHGHFATSGSKARRCLRQGGSLDDCAKEDCLFGHGQVYETEEGQEYHCEEQGWEPKYIARKNNNTRRKLGQDPKPITANPYVRDGEDSD